MKKRKLAVTAAALGAVLVILAVLMAVPQCRWAVLSVVSRKPVCPECGYYKGVPVVVEKEKAE